MKSNQIDFLDAEAIAEAARKNMRFVPIKTDDQLNLQALHRMRDRLRARRTSLINQIQAFLLKRGIVFAETPARLRERMADILENVDENLMLRMGHLLSLPCNGWTDLGHQLNLLNQEVKQIASSDAACLRLRQIPHVGPLVATAIVAAIADGSLHQGCEFAAWMGLVQRRYSTGEKTKLLGISKARRIVPTGNSNPRSPFCGASLQTRPSLDGFMDDRA